MKTYNTMSEIRIANSAIDHKFFNHQSMKFFNSRIVSGVLRGNYFITSERFDDKAPAKYTVRMCVSGSVETVGKFNELRTKEAARELIYSLPVQLPAAYQCAADEFNGKQMQGMG